MSAPRQLDLFLEDSAEFSDAVEIEVSQVFGVAVPKPCFRSRAEMMLEQANRMFASYDYSGETHVVGDCPKVECDECDRILFGDNK